METWATKKSMKKELEEKCNQLQREREALWEKIGMSDDSCLPKVPWEDSEYYNEKEKKR